MIILLLGISFMLVLAYRSLYFARHNEKILAWLTFSWFLFIARYTGAFWYVNGENDLQNSQNIWYFDILKDQWSILITLVNLILSQIAAAIRDHNMKQPV